MRSIKIKLTDKQREKAEAFTDARTQTALYQKRGGFKREDILVGALGELGAYKYFKKRGFTNISKPDFEIYSGRKKSYDADLTAGKRHFHVKAQSQESIKRYGHSWLMQRKDPVLQKVQYNQYMIPCAVDLERNEVELFGCISFKSIMERGLIGECKHPAFRTYKVAIYFDNLLTLSHNQRWRAFNLFSDKKKEDRNERRENKDSLLQQQRLHNEGGVYDL